MHKSNKLTIIILAITLLAMILPAGCSSDNNKKGTEDILSAHYLGSMELEHATQFHVDYYEDNIAVVSIDDGLSYMLVPDEDELPDWLFGGELGEMTIIETPAHKVYNAASSSMDLIDALGAVDSVVMTSTKASDWGIDKIRELVSSDRIQYIGKYSAPDYEALLNADIDLAIESTMIYHSPEVKEQLESLGIPVLIERSSYESDPLGRLEWIRLYGLLLGCREQADDYFNEQAAKLNSIIAESGKEASDESTDGKPSVAFFSVNSNGSVVVRKPGDYVTKMIEMAGGVYALSGITNVDDNSLSTMNMQMEAFYDKAVSADIIIYNSTIEGSLKTIDDLTDLSDRFADFKAVKDGNVWCTNASMFQRTTDAADMIIEMKDIFTGADKDSEMEYFHRLAS